MQKKYAINAINTPCHTLKISALENGNEKVNIFSWYKRYQYWIDQWKKKYSSVVGVIEFV